MKVIFFPKKNPSTIEKKVKKLNIRDLPFNELIRSLRSDGARVEPYGLVDANLFGLNYLHP